MTTTPEEGDGPLLEALGPDLVPAWCDLSNVNKLCLRCQSIPWHLYEFEENDFLNKSYKYDESSSGNQSTDSWAYKPAREDLHDMMNEGGLEEYLERENLRRPGGERDLLTSIAALSEHEIDNLESTPVDDFEPDTCDNSVAESHESHRDQSRRIEAEGHSVIDEDAHMLARLSVHHDRTDTFESESSHFSQHLLPFAEASTTTAVEDFPPQQQPLHIPREQFELDDFFPGSDDGQYPVEIQSPPRSILSIYTDKVPLSPYLSVNTGSRGQSLYSHPSEQPSEPSLKYFGHIFRPHIFRPDPMGPYIEFWKKGSGPKLRDVRESAEQGCHFCCLVLTALILNRSNLLLETFLGSDTAREASEDDEIQIRGRVYKSGPSGLYRRYLDGWVRGRGHGIYQIGVRISVLSDEPDHPLLKEEIKEISVADSAESIAKFWLHDCIKHHACTSSKVSDVPLPTRVIDVSRTGSDGGVFLFESKGTKASYATLSYRWGQCKLLRTTKASYGQHLSSIPMHAMPRTFQDAIEMTIALGIQFLWIDALCIIQDSEEDCQRELGSMADIYSNSTITIAAVGATSAESGFPLNRNKLGMVDCQVSLDITLSADLAGQEYIFESGTIFSRAWCFQEIQLTPRLLSCGVKELYFRCSHGVRREGHPTKYHVDYKGEQVEAGLVNNVPDNFSVSDASLEIRNSRRLVDQSPTADISYLHRKWRELIGKYTSMDLTFKNDKLDAISALATRFPSLFSDEADRPTSEDYLAGLWRADLRIGLLAEYTFVHPDQRQPIPFRAPSWSWASTDARVFRFRDQSNKFCCEVLEATVTPASSLIPFGRVQSGKITIFGPVTNLPMSAFLYDEMEQNPGSDGSGDFDRLVEWNYTASRDPGCICLAITFTDALILSPVRKPGATQGIYQRVGISTDFRSPPIMQGIRLKDGIHDSSFTVDDIELGDSAWRLDVVTII